jgi:preprotein translocase subunit SecG
MNVLFNLVVAVQVLSALVIIGLVLLQHGKGADMGAAFGSGASGSLFGATGSSNFMSKSTGVAAAIFFSATLGLSYMANERNTTVSGGVMDKVTVPVAPTTGSAAIPTAAPAVAPAAATPAASVPAAAASAPAGSTPATQIPK